MSKPNPFAAAERKGREAARAGLPPSSCPYGDPRKADGRLTFGRAWRNAWMIAYKHEAQLAGTHRPCPFCGADLGTKSAAGYHYHPANDCILSGFEVAGDELGAWNRRAYTTDLPQDACTSGEQS